MPASDDLQWQARQAAQRLFATFEQTARVLERSAVLADDYAQRAEQAGRRDAAAKERLLAEQAREAARAHADRLP